MEILSNFIFSINKVMVSYLHYIPLSVYATIFVFSICVGSFFNVVLFRYPIISTKAILGSIIEYFKEEKISPHQELEERHNKLENVSFSLPASHCMHCDHELKWYDNIPLISYLFLKGKCRYCGVKISIQYPIVELTTAIVMTLGSFLFIHNSMGFLMANKISVGLFLFFLLITWVLSLIDFKTLTLPDPLVFSLLWVGLIAATIGITILPKTTIDLTDSVYGAAVGYSSLFIITFLFKKIRGQEAMGQGDFKLLAALGVFIGVKGVIFTIVVSSFIGVLTWIVYSILNKINQKEQSNIIPFGPSLIFASWIFIFYGKQILSAFGY
jgi:leader peptidase (prepilin peptidase) / N-methyltransferase